jgi:hypothetical protein
MDDMTVLSVTRTHLKWAEFQEEPEAVGFISLSLYQTVRTDEMFTNGTIIAFGGSALYNNSEAYKSIRQPIVDFVLFRCFLGRNETPYVQALRSVGWTNLERVLVMAMNGSIVYLNADGTDGVIDNPSNEGTNGATMDKDMSKMIYFVSVFVPLSLIFLIGICFTCYLIRHNIQWKQRREADMHPVWINIHTGKRMLRRRTLDGSMTGNQMNDNGSDELTLDLATVVPPVDAGGSDTTKSLEILRTNSTRSTSIKITGFHPMNDVEGDSSNVPMKTEKVPTGRSLSRRPSQCVEV